MRYYLVKIAYNKVAQAEDRPQPAGFNTYDEAEKALHQFFSSNILGSTIGWCEAFIFNSEGGLERSEIWQDSTDPDEVLEAIENGVITYEQAMNSYPKYREYITEQYINWLRSQIDNEPEEEPKE